MFWLLLSIIGMILASYLLACFLIGIRRYVIARKRKKEETATGIEPASPR